MKQILLSLAIAALFTPAFATGGNDGQQPTLSAPSAVAPEQAQSAERYDKLVERMQNADSKKEERVVRKELKNELKKDVKRIKELEAEKDSKGLSTGELVGLLIAVLGLVLLIALGGTLGLLIGLALIIAGVLIFVGVWGI